MADYLGHYNTSGSRTTVRFSFTTHDKDGGAVAPSSAFENADLRIYKDGSATQRSSSSGITMTSPFDSVTGLHNVAIDLTDNTDAGFYAAGSFYECILVPDETVDTETVVAVLARFEIGPPQVNVTQFGGTNGTFSSGRPEVNASHISGSAVSTSTAQIGVNVVNFGGSAGTFSSGRPEVNTSHIAGSSVSTSSAQIGVNVVNAGGTAWGSGAITAASIASDAITAAKIADNAIDAGAIAADAITAAKIADGAIDANTFAAGAITATAIAADAIGASELAADAIAEIQSGLATASALATVDTVVDGIQADLDNGTDGLGALKTLIDNVDNFIDTEISALTAASIVASGTIGSTGNSTTALHLDGLTYGDDEINDYLLVIRDVSESEYHTRWIDDWTATGDIATVATLPFTPQNATDTYTILPVRRDALTAANVWTAGTRTLTALDEDSTTLDLDTTIRSALGLVDNDLGTRLDVIDSNVDAILVDTGTTLQAELDGIQADTEDIQSRLPAALVGGRIDATIDATGLEAGALALINTEIDTALADIHLDHLLATDYDPASKPGTATALLNELIENDGGVSRFTANALEQAPTGGSAPSAADIADAVWDEALAGHLGTGSTGNALNAAGSAGDPWATALPGAYGSGTAGKIIGDNINATISSRATQTSVDAIDGIVDAILVDTGTTLQAELDGIQADTEDIQSRLPAALVSGRIDASVGAMAANTVTASAVASDAVTEIQSGLATASAISALNNLSAAQVNAEVDTALADINLDHLVKSAVDTDWATTVHLNSVLGHIADNGTTATFDRTTDSLEALQAEHDATQTALGTIDTAVGVIDGIVDLIKVKTDNLPIDPADASDITMRFNSLDSAVAVIDGIVDDILVDTGTTLQAELDGIQADTEDIQSRLPTALVSGRMDASVGAMAANTVTASAVASDAVTEIQSGLATASALSTAQGNITDILADTNELQGDITNGGRVDLLIDAIKAKTDNLPTDPADQSAVEAAITAATSPLATAAALDTVDNFLDTEISAIKAKTDSLTFTQAGVVDSNIQYVNDVQVTGTGETGSEWGPA